MIIPCYPPKNLRAGDEVNGLFFSGHADNFFYNCIKELM